MTEEDLAAQMEADRLLQATLRAQVYHVSAWNLKKLYTHGTMYLHTSYAPG